MSLSKAWYSFEEISLKSLALIDGALTATGILKSLKSITTIEPFLPFNRSYAFFWALKLIEIFKSLPSIKSSLPISTFFCPLAFLKKNLFPCLPLNCSSYILSTPDFPTLLHNEGVY